MNDDKELASIAEMVSQAYTLSDALPEGPTKWLVDFAGWCLEDALCTQDDTTPEATVRASLKTWLENLRERCAPTPE